MTQRQCGSSTCLVGLEPRLDGRVGDGGATTVKDLTGTFGQIFAIDALFRGEFCCALEWFYVRHWRLRQKWRQGQDHHLKEFTSILIQKSIEAAIQSEVRMIIAQCC